MFATSPNAIQPVIDVNSSSRQFRRKSESTFQAYAAISSRRRMGAIVLAVIAVAALGFRRSDYDHPGALLTEILLNAGLVFATWRFGLRAKTHQPTIITFGALLVIVLPWLADQVFRLAGLGNGMEIVMLTSLAWGGVVAAILGRNCRTIGLSVVCSGFLTLFTTCIADKSLAVGFAYAWGLICLWWLVANHWERVETCAAVDIRHTSMPREATLVLGFLYLLWWHGPYRVAFLFCVN